jgi:selenocysteine lyase/cysteine desulfurase
MNNNRREFLQGIGGLAAAGAVARVGAAALDGAPAAPAARLPAQADFAIPEDVTYINSAYIHPMPRVAVAALNEYARTRSQPEAQSHRLEIDSVKDEFAALINAKPSEISFVTSTSAGENLIVNGMDIARGGGNVVTDALHFDGAIMHLSELKARYGVDLRLVQPRDWRIEMKDLERVVDKKTRLIEISLVGMINGFQHDLKAVCDLAHAHGALVYVDVAQAAGATPIDVRASGVDFLACCSFKWLMGDFGLGFLYVREELLDRVVKRTEYGYFQAPNLEPQFLPGDSGKLKLGPYSWKLGADASGHFEVGTLGIPVTHVLAKSLPLIRGLGVENIQAHRQPLLKRLHAEMPRLGYQPLTPPETPSSIISFAIEDPTPVVDRLRKARINATVRQRYLRLSPSVFNDTGDIGKLLEALS